jgi:soluble lytic murein transglycosylase-like protein
MKPCNILVALCALLLLALALPRGANRNNIVNGGAEGSANLAKPRAHQFEKETREAWIDESYKTSSSKPQESRKIRPVDFLVNLPRLSTMRNSGSAAGRLPAKAFGRCASSDADRSMSIEPSNHRTAVEKQRPLLDRMAAISQKCPTASMEIILAAFKYGRQYQIEPELLLAIAHEESRFIPTRRSKSSLGLMGVNYNVWKTQLHLDMDRIYEIDYNMDKGAAILRWWIDVSQKMKKTVNFTENEILWLAVHRYNNGYKYNNMKYVPKVRKFYRGIGGVK